MSRILVLVPTAAERGVIEPRLAAIRGDCRIETCGFGVVAAAARAAGLVAELRPRRVILVGIAGRFDERVPLGEARVFGSVACHGIGVGEGEGFVPAASLGWRQWPGDARTPAVADAIDLGAGPTGWPAESSRADLLLTVAAASADAADARRRLSAHPRAAAEDMEGFAVALACGLAGVPCTIVRGLSNTVGDRDRSGWRVAEALEAAAALTLRLFAPPADPPEDVT